MLKEYTFLGAILLCALSYVYKRKEEHWARLRPGSERLGEERVTTRTEDVGVFELSKLMAFERRGSIAAVKDMLSTLTLANDDDLVTSDVGDVFGSAGDINGESRETLDRKVECFE